MSKMKQIDFFSLKTYKGSSTSYISNTLASQSQLTKVIISISVSFVYNILCMFNLYENLRLNEAAFSDHGNTKLDHHHQLSYNYLNSHINHKTA